MLEFANQDPSFLAFVRSTFPAAEVVPAVVAPKVAQRIIARGKTKFYELLAEQKIDAIKDGASTLITVESIFRYLSSLPRAEFRSPAQPNLRQTTKRTRRRRDRCT